MRVFKFIFAVLALLGIWTALFALDLKHNVSRYFTRVVEEERIDVGKYIFPPTLFIVVGFLVFLFAGFLYFALGWKKRLFFGLYIVLMTPTTIIQISALTLLIQGEGGQMPEMVMINSIGNYYNDSSPAQSVYVNFWDNLQENVKCCGINNYSDWVNATQAPQVGFIPESCCIRNSSYVANCTEAITRDNMNNVEYVEKMIYTKGCLAKNYESVQILLIKIFSGITMLFQTSGMIIPVLGCANGADYEIV